MGLTPLELQQQPFKTVFRGYDPDDVQHILSVAAREMELLARQVNELKEANLQQQKVIERYSEREDELKKTLLMTQQVATDMKTGARKEADLIIGRAELEAERLLDHAQERLTNLLTDISNLKRQRKQVEGELKGILDAHYGMLQIEKATPERANPSQLKVVGGSDQISKARQHRIAALAE